MTPIQLHSICHLFLRHLLDQRLPDSVHHLCAKVVIGLVETIASKDTQQNAARTLKAVLNAYVDKIMFLAEAQVHLVNKITAASKAGKGKVDESVVDATVIEKARPLGGATYAIEKPGEALLGELLGKERI